MAFDLIMAYEEDIQRLNISIQQREQLLKQDILSDEGIKQLGNDVQARYFSNIFLQNLKDERDRRHVQQQQQ